MSVDERMLKELGLESVDDLFSDIPPEVRVEGIDLPPGMSEIEVIREIGSILDSNMSADRCPCFMGGGLYNHFIPSALRTILSRSEFYTSYTPYQAEISQGMLQSLFEYQSFIAELTQMEAVNSSMYDASTALGEAATMCHRISGRRKFLIPRNINWEKRSVLLNYVHGLGMEVLDYGFTEETGEIDLDDLKVKADNDVAGLYAEVPNLFGVVDRQVPKLKEMFPDVALVVGVHPLSLGILRPPGEYGADIVVGEGQPLGMPVSFGGPLLGIFAARQEHVRKMPGRVIGLTRDAGGKRAYCMTLQTREQHIRRSKATSNICSNEALMALAAAAYLALVGREGLRTLAKMNISRAKDLMERIGEIRGFQSPVFQSYHFNEFAVRTPIKPEKMNKVLLRKGIIGGLPLGQHVAGMKDHMLIATTEMNTDADHDRLIAAMEEIL